ncbi:MULTISPECIES: SDR family NAD(P)-dependent oxidoreductase [unclassified Chelatococcus]|uniref:SDR family NAD(P)-dependent oxidoreductase n=1 Tax=unclassified Chelatococcus TaxID=2638111 RepID=UPI0002FA1A36|nr:MULTISPECIES: SDR family oxidoreductase [unclassified Chelatococcus]ALA20253.1 short-chain dehydrogenase [Chelatococcus sp. CO-6]
MTIALITGGSRGLGRSAALHLARNGVGIVLTYQSNAAAAEEVVAAIRAEGGKAVALPLDTGRVGTFRAFAETLAGALRQHWGSATFDILMNNAGHGVHRSFAETSEEEFDGLMAVHLKGVFFLTQTLLPMIADGGRILNVSTGLARFSLPGYAAYATMKGGVEVLTRYLAKELGPRRIAVNTIAPGATETDFGGGAVRDVPDVNRMVAETTAMGRAGRPDDIGAAVAALLAPGTGWMTAQRIEVSGGQNL